MPRDIEKEIEERFGHFMILGRAGRIYNGKLEPATSVKDIADYVSEKENTLIQELEKEIWAKKSYWLKNKQELQNYPGEMSVIKAVLGTIAEIEVLLKSKKEGK